MSNWTVTRDVSVRYGKQFVRVAVLFTLQGLPAGSRCSVYRIGSLWVRKTVNEGMKGSVRYEHFMDESQALRSGERWAARKARERARAERKAAKQ